MLAVLRAGTILGVDAIPVCVEVRLGGGLPGFDIVGLPETAVRESRVRVRSALDALGFQITTKQVLLNLAPGDVRKSGSSFDLAIAVAVLVACGEAPAGELDRTLLLGELSLGGELRPVRGALAHLRAARREGVARAVLPIAQRAEAALVPDLEVRLARDLGEVVAWLRGQDTLPRARREDADAPVASGPDLADVRGQGAARRALEVAAAGGHHALLVGPPGAGKTLLARRLPPLLPPPDAGTILDVATIASAAGLPAPPVGSRPFRAPHHTASAAAMIGGGEPVRPGEVTLAHGGVLFLDELPEFRRDVLESLRTVVESGRAVVARARARVDMPAAPLVVAAMNPCPCGWFGDERRPCRCVPDRVGRYQGRVSGPLLDRFDLQVAVPRLESLRHAPRGEPTETVRARVVAARALLDDVDRRARGEGATATGFERLVAACDPPALTLLDRATAALGTSARGYEKVLRVARTIAALAGRPRVDAGDVAEALQYRVVDAAAPEAGAGPGGAGRVARAG